MEVPTQSLVKATCLMIGTAPGTERSPGASGVSDQ